MRNDFRKGEEQFRIWKNASLKRIDGSISVRAHASPPTMMIL